MIGWMSSPSFGYVLPPSEGADVPDPEKVWEIARIADDSDLEYLWVSDHLMFWHAMYESLSVLSALAARTERVRLGTAVLQLAMRQPVFVAKTLASIERLSRGRLTVGVGVGGEFPAEWEAAEVAVRSRGKRTDEMIQALRGLWGPGSYEQQTKHVHIKGVDLHPKPSAFPPIWIGGRKEPSVRRAATFGDGWMGIFLTPEMYAERLVQLRAHCEKVGRDPAEVFPSLYVWTCIAETMEKATEVAHLLSAFYNTPFEKLERFAVIGDPEACVRRFREYADAGARHFAVAPISAEVSAAPLIDLTEKVIPLVAGA